MGRSRLLTIIAVLGLLLAACGDDDDTNAASEDATEETAEDTTQDATEDTAGDGGSGGTDLSDVDLGDCGFLAEFATMFEELDNQAMFGGEDGDFGSFIQGAAEALDQVADDAPSEIQDSFQVMADAFGELAGTLEGVTLDLSDPENMDPEAMQAFEEVGRVFQSEEFTAASEEVDAWVNEHCPELVNTSEPGS